MTATIINGRAIADAVLLNIAQQVSALGAPLHLAAVCVGDDAGLRSFVRLKQKAAQSVGIQFSSYYFDATDDVGVRKTLQFLAGDDTVNGIFVELPLPSEWNRNEILSLIPKEKDVDALTAYSSVPAPAVVALQYILTEHDISLKGKRAAVIGAGELVGQPVAAWLTAQGAWVDVIDIGTEHPENITREADMIIAAAGSPGLVTADWVKEGAIVIDYGFGKKGKEYVGDVDVDSVHKKAGFLTPVPGGMGPLVVAAVLENLLTLSVRPS